MGRLILASRNIISQLFSDAVDVGLDRALGNAQPVRKGGLEGLSQTAVEFQGCVQWPPI
jgi:hypothetical protein